MPSILENTATPCINGPRRPRGQEYAISTEQAHNDRKNPKLVIGGDGHGSPDSPGQQSRGNTSNESGKNDGNVELLLELFLFELFQVICMRLVY